MLFPLPILASAVALGLCPTYTVLYVGGPNCGVFGPEGAGALGMSSSGHMLCGQSSTCQVEYFAFSWQPGGLLTPVAFSDPATYSRAYDVNADGVVVGEADVDGQPARLGFRSEAGTTSLLPPLKGDIWSEAHAINRAGTIAGMSSGAQQRAVYWADAPSSPVMLILPIGPTSMAEDINDVSQICGWMGIDPYPTFGATPFIWHNGKASALPLPPYAAADSGTATALNNLGDACGYFFVTHPEKEYVRRACAWIDGDFIDLGLLPGTAGSIARDISDAREVVGYCTGPTGGFARGFLWRDGVMHDVLDLVPPGTFSQVSPHAINSAGQVAGGASLLPDNDGVAFRLTPALPQTPGDTDCSGTVNIDDLLTVIDHWNSTGPVGGDPADVNRDNRIDIEDLLQVLSNWTR